MRVRDIELVGAWSQPELDLINRAFARLPAPWLEHNQCFTTLARQPKLDGAPSTAPGHSQYIPAMRKIVLYDKGVYDNGRVKAELLYRSLFHELGHTIIACRPAMLQAWQAQTAEDDFVDEYAKTNAAEDFCDTFSEFFIFPTKTKRLVPRKWYFINDLLQQANSTEKIAMSFIPSFANELTKVAVSPGARRGLMNMLRSAAGSKVGKGAAIAGLGILGGGSLGVAKGRNTGYEMGTSDVANVAQKALAIGRQQGAQIGYSYAMKQMQAGQK